MLFDKILKLGHPGLYQISETVKEEQLPALQADIQTLHDLILECQRRYGFGRGIAAPQIGVRKRIVCLNLEGQAYTLFNPKLTDKSEEMLEIWDDCMCFPNLLVRVKRHQSCTLTFRDADWQEQTWPLNGAESELLQHECDHLDGILATQRAIDNQSFRIKA